MMGLNLSVMEQYSQFSKYPDTTSMESEFVFLLESTVIR